MRKSITFLLKVLFPFILGGGILYWMYRDFPFSELKDTLLHKMCWEWMLLSFIPGITAQVFRGLRWRQSLEPLDERPRNRTCISAIYISYAVSLIIPRIGEVMRCGILSKHEGASFSHALGTVVTERIVDTIIIFFIIMGVFLWQFPIWMHFLDLTGLSFHSILSQFSLTGIIVTLICIAGIIGLGIFLLSRIGYRNKFHKAFTDLVAGIISLKKVHNIPLYLFYSLGIWVSYFLHYYLTFFCFDYTSILGMDAGLVSFCVGTIAVLVPTPNGAGSWHFAVKTVLMLYGIPQMLAISFTLIVHSVQTLLIILLGAYGWGTVLFLKKRTRKEHAL